MTLEELQKENADLLKAVQDATAEGIISQVLLDSMTKERDDLRRKTSSLEAILAQYRSERRGLIDELNELKKD